jgi:hypothetical protein
MVSFSLKEKNPKNPVRQENFKMHYPFLVAEEVKWKIIEKS